MGGLLGAAGLGVRRVFGRLTGPTPGRTLVAITGVALAIAVLVIVTGLSLGLAGSAAVTSEDVDYWIVPEEEESGVSPLAYEEAQLGAVHDAREQIAANDAVEYTTPVAIQPVNLANPETESEGFVLALGVVPDTGSPSIAGIRTDTLDTSYPFYADGGYNGSWTGELIASPGVSELVGVEPGDRLTAGSDDRSLTVVDVAEDDPTVGPGETPVVVMHLAELQALTGLDRDDQADQMLVDSGGTDIQHELETIYEGTSVVTRGGLFEASTTPTNLPFAMALASGLIALGIGIAFVATMMGLELTATRESLAVLQAIGFSRLGIGILLASETVTVAVLGGVLGVALGMAGIFGVNAGIGEFLGLPTVATLDPVLLGYGLVAAAVVGLVSVVYPLYIAWRTEPVAELG